MPTRRSALRAALGVTVGVVGSGVGAATRHGGEPTTVDPARVRRSLRRLGDLSPPARRDAWRRLPESRRETLAAAVSPGRVVTDTRETAAGDATTVTHTVTLRGGLDLVTIAEFDHEVSWEHDGTAVRGVEQTTTARISHEAVSVWRYRGTGQETVANQAEWTEAFVSGLFEWGLTADGSARDATAYSRLRLRADGGWSVETSRYEL
ncbi:MAG: hypothetical protein J07HB67_02296 [halophilic archaeon J07HB67]|nr:MAG: hypothetical protein J07HB67_02296 [halophilic archaeon J07HB67]